MVKTKSMIIGGGIIIVVIIMIIVFSVSSTLLNDDGIPDLTIAIDKEDIRVNEIFNASLSQNMKNCNITWDFNDGNISYGQKVSHTYSCSNKYEIKVTISSSTDKNIVKTSIMVRNQDEMISFSWGSVRNYRLGTTKIYPIGSEVYPGISKPTLRFEISFKNAFGNYRILLELINDRTGESTNVFSENHRWTFEDVDLEYTFNEGEYPELDETYWIQMEIRLEEGSWNSMVQSMEVIY